MTGGCTPPTTLDDEFLRLVLGTVGIPGPRLLTASEEPQTMIEADLRQHPRPPKNVLVERVSASYLHDEAHEGILVPQIEHRLNLAEAWGLLNHEAVLDIGCGQGESTLAFAAWVGEYGTVIGIDPGAPDYGSPITLGQSWEYIKRSPLGARIKFKHLDLKHFLHAFYSFGGNPFHTATLCHSLWYFPTREAISRVFGLLGKKGIVKRVLVAEYTGEARTAEQLPHEYAFKTQRALFRARRLQREIEREDEIVNGAIPDPEEDEDAPGDDPMDLGNIREAPIPSDIIQLAAATGWLVHRQGVLPTPDGMRDGQWEVEHVLSPEFTDAVLALHDYTVTSVILDLIEQVRDMRDAMAAKGQRVQTMDAAWMVFMPGEMVERGVKNNYYHQEEARQREQSLNTNPLPLDIGFGRRDKRRSPSPTESSSSSNSK